MTICKRNTLTDGWTHTQTYRSKPICPLNFLEVGGIINPLQKWPPTLAVFFFTLKLDPTNSFPSNMAEVQQHIYLKLTVVFPWNFRQFCNGNADTNRDDYKYLFLYLCFFHKELMATSWENLFLSHVSNKGADQPTHVVWSALLLLAACNEILQLKAIQLDWHISPTCQFAESVL